MKTTELAPIVLFVYNRLEHTKQTIESLKKNTLAQESELYVFSDGFKSDGDRQQVEEVRAFIATVEGFKKIHIHIKEQNAGLSASVIAGVSQVLATYPKAIVLEDDLITSSDFLEYMNKALEVYEADMNIYSISGYTFPSPYLLSMEQDLFLYPRPASWGWATWKNRWEQADWSMKDFSSFSKDKVAIKEFVRGGEDMYVMLLKQQKGLIQSWAIRWAYVHFKHQAYSLYLRKSKVRSIGTDNSGTNLPKTTKYDTSVFNQELALPKTMLPDRQLILTLKDFYAPSLIRKIINTFKFGFRTWLKASK